MAVDVLTDIVIDRSVEQVSGYAADPGNAPEWYVKSGRLIGRLHRRCVSVHVWASSRSSWDAAWPILTRSSSSNPGSGL